VSLNIVKISASTLRWFAMARSIVIHPPFRMFTLILDINEQHRKFRG